MPEASTNNVDAPAVFSAGAGALSVALMDARNHTLHLFGLLAEVLEPEGFELPHRPEIDPPLWLLGHIGWFQERWIARNLQRQAGAAADPAGVRLPSVLAEADACWDDAQLAPAARWELKLPDYAGVRDYLLQTLETSLELLDKAGGDDASLYFHRLALLHEDRRGEDLIVMAQLLGIPLRMEVAGPMAPRAPVTVQGGRWDIGNRAGAGFACDNERPVHRVEIPEFEIDAQVVSWAQYVEFVDDGGYDRPELWHPDGWAWLQQQSAEGAGGGEGTGGRAPRFVEQIGVASGAVMQTRFGTARRMLAGQPVTHVSWWEADAWCRWAGRRLPAEVEWEVAATTAARRGWRWGDVWEWTATTSRPYPGFVAGPWRGLSEPHFGQTKVLRGASFATRARLRSATARHFASPGANHLFSGFRSCAI